VTIVSFQWEERQMTDHLAPHVDQAAVGAVVDAFTIPSTLEIQP
jgi:hypothetical protein